MSTITDIAEGSNFVKGNEGGNPCLVSGTHLSTPRGSVCVENLRAGAMVLTASGESRPVRWLGHRALDCSRYPEPATVWPIRITAGAFADDQPSRDLWVSPGHAIFVEGVLIQAEKLVNGATILQVPQAQVDYWHVELDSHDILLTEDLPTESYLDTGNRCAFYNGGEYLEANPDFRPKHWSETCVPLIMEGSELQRVKSSLVERAQALGFTLTDDADAHLIADGERIEALSLGATRLAFVIPAARTTIELRCRGFVPTQVLPPSDDARELGLCVGRLQIDGADVPLDDESAFAQGWHDLEVSPTGKRQRWTKERSPLPAGTRLVIIDLVARSYCWAKPVPVAVAGSTARHS